MTTHHDHPLTVSKERLQRLKKAGINKVSSFRSIFNVISIVMILFLFFNIGTFYLENDSSIDEFNKNGNPRAFSYFNILSKNYLEAIIKSINRKVKISFVKDNFFSKKNINESIKKEKRSLATRIIGNEQVSGCLLQPHHFIIIQKK